MNDASDTHYPLGQFQREDTDAKSGCPLREITLDRVVKGEAKPDDLAASAETLLKQAAVARNAGYPEVAANLMRAAEMTRMPDAEILEIYEALRPGRSTYHQLLSLSQRLASMYKAEFTGAYIREAADAYRDTGLLKMDED